MEISIHAPRTGSDVMYGAPSTITPISIHAPRTGSDKIGYSYALLKNNFNPRSPHGERQTLFRLPESCNYFNPRSPHGERRNSYIYMPLRILYFNPRSPHGERLISNRDKPQTLKFQSTLPARGATMQGYTFYCHRDFNPRSPHGERR